MHWLVQGLGVDACHCMDCNTCMALSEFKGHKCRELSACPVCADALFHSSQPYRVRPALETLSAPQREAHADPPLATLLCRLCSCSAVLGHFVRQSLALHDAPYLRSQHSRQL